ncbi:hypothetical protein [Aquibacillus albus]|uniref:NEAT domain-containing protein n=1 Tax=Aquibacillus albus TaxID=1168171 RepID=A0ABS2MWI6_9BACI|nr:hypothetical protein [Aquibacillus albus]MBM7570262.1 hypothetical protein [Aquibacillus albus]
MKTQWKVVCFIVTIFVTVGLSGQYSVTAASVTEDYVIKVDDQFYSYNKEKLNESFLNHTYGGGSASLYLDFKDKLESGDFHAIMNADGKYISYTAIEDAFIADQDNFSLSEYLNSSGALKASMPSEITVVTTNSSGSITTTSVEIDNGLVPEVINIF